MDNAQEKGGTFFEKYGTALAVIVGAVIIAGAFAFGQGGTPKGDMPEAAAVNIKDVDTAGDPYLGNPNAPVVMAYWFDYQCPFCKQFEETTMQELYKNYVETGKLKIVIQDFQFLGPDSDDGALFARAVWEAYPDHFYDWFKAMFAAQDEEHAGFGNLDSIVAMTKAQVPAIDTDKVLALITEKKAAYQKTIEADRTEGSRFGINGTPSFIVGTTLLSGAQPYAAVAQLVDAELAK